MSLASEAALSAQLINVQIANQSGVPDANVYLLLSDTPPPAASVSGYAFSDNQAKVQVNLLGITTLRLTILSDNGPTAKTTFGKPKDLSTKVLQSGAKLRVAGTAVNVTGLGKVKGQATTRSPGRKKNYTAKITGSTWTFSGLRTFGRTKPIELKVTARSKEGKTSSRAYTVKVKNHR